MHALLIFMRVLEVLFLVGLAGSAIVVVISFVEDLGVLIGIGEEKHNREALSEDKLGEAYVRREGQRSPMHPVR